MAFKQLKPGTLLSPTPVVMISCQAEGTRPNIITLAWVGTVNSDPPMVSISVRPERHSHRLILDSGEFVVNLVNRALMKATDWCGVKSGRDIDKFAACGFDPLPLEALRFAPAIAQSPVYLACKLRHSMDLGSHTLMLGEIVEMGIQDSLMDDGRIAFERADLVAYCHGEYMGLKKPEGFFGYSVARPEVLKRRLRGR